MVGAAPGDPGRAIHPAPCNPACTRPAPPYSKRADFMKLFHTDDGVIRLRVPRSSVRRRYDSLGVRRLDVPFGPEAQGPSRLLSSWKTEVFLPGGLGSRRATLGRVLRGTLARAASSPAVERRHRSAPSVKACQRPSGGASGRARTRGDAVTATGSGLVQSRDGCDRRIARRRGGVNGRIARRRQRTRNGHCTRLETRAPSCRGAIRAASNPG